MKTKKEVNLLIKTIGQFTSLISDFSEFSKKNPNVPINLFKLNIVNSVLKVAKSFLSSEYLPLDEFSSFGEDDLPTNSDVLLILNLYLRGFERFVEDNINYDFSNNTQWKLEGKNSDIDVDISELFGRKDG